MKRCLVLDGGGVRGLIPLQVLCKIEEKIGKPLAWHYDLIVGSSVGSILGSMIATGKYSMLSISDAMNETLPKIFKRRMWPLMPKYDRKEFITKWDQMLPGFKMRECKARFMSTAVNMCDGKTHFFKSWENKDGKLDLLDVVLRSFAAPIYFGAINDAVNESTWIDGGCGGENTPILTALVETIRQGWLGSEHIHIDSLGCGYVDQTIKYEDASKYRWLKEGLFFIDPKDGGLARSQATEYQLNLMRTIDDVSGEITFKRYDTQIPKKLDLMDGIKYIDEYKKIGLKIAEEV